MVRTYRELEWAKTFKSTRLMVEKMQSPRRPKSRNTIRQYLYGVRVFNEFLKTDNPDEALKIAKVDLHNKAENGDACVDFKADAFVDFLLLKRAPKTVRLMFQGFKAWLETNGVDVSVLKTVELPRSNDVKTEDRKCSMLELNTILSFANLRDVAMIQTALSSGLRVNTLAGLQLKDIAWNPYELINEKVDDAQAPAMISVVPKEGRKTARKFFTFITPQAKQSLRLYHDWRRRKGEALTDDSYLIANVYEKNGVASGQRVNSDSLTRNWIRFLEKAGLNQKSHKWFTLHFHTLRKFFRSECINAGVADSYTQFWMGHAGGYLDDSYFRENLKQHLTQYVKAIPCLTVKGTDATNADIQKLYQNGEQKEKRIEELTAQMYDLQQGNLKLDKIMEIIIMDKSTNEETKRKFEMLKSIVGSTKPQNK